VKLLTFFPRHSAPKYLRGLRVRATAPTTHRKRVQAKPIKHTTSQNVRSTPSQRDSLKRGVRVARLSGRRFQRYDAINNEMSASSANP
jgi:hypothetical protein